MAVIISIRIDDEVCEIARQAAALEHRTVVEQVEFWVKVGRAVMANPELPGGFVAESLASMAEPHEFAQPFQCSPQAAVDALKSLPKVRGVRDEEVASWITEGRR